MRCENKTVGVQCTLEHEHAGNHAWFTGSGGFTWPRLHMLGAGPIIWRQVVNVEYPGRNLGEGPPFSRTHISALAADRCKASREYYRRIDKI